MGRPPKPRLQDEVSAVSVEGEQEVVVVVELVFAVLLLQADRCAAPTAGDLGP